MKLRIVAVGAAVILTAGCTGTSVSGSAEAESAGSAAETSTGQISTGQTSDEPSVETLDEPSESAGTQTTQPESAESEMTSSPAPETSDAPAPDAVEQYVYYVVDTNVGLRLARELREVVTPAEAIQLMIDGADDPDYATTWNPDTVVNAVTTDGDVITVDLSGDARTANVGSGGAAIMVQQLVWTVTEALGQRDASVLLRLDGADPGDLWGALTWEGPIPRAEPGEVRVVVQIDTPRQGQELTSPVTVAGDAAAFEATVPWRILDSSGAEVDSGFTMTSEGQTFSPYSFTVDLAPGDYTVEIAQDDPSDGQAGPPSVDTRDFTVTG